MFKPKKIILSALFGFFLSFIISIFSTHKFGVSILRALIFALVFGILGAIINFLYDKYLFDKDYIVNPDDVKVKSSKSDNIVDITIDDENLSEDDSGPKFEVENNKTSSSRAMENSFVDQKSTTSSGKTETVNEFKPVQLDSISSSTEEVSVSDFLGDSSDSSTVPNKSTASIKNETSIINPGPELSSAAIEENRSEDLSRKAETTAPEIDELPEFSELSASSSNNNMDEIIEPTEFSQESVSDFVSTNVSSFDTQSSTNQEASTIASAIRTILTRE